MSIVAVMAGIALMTAPDVTRGIALYNSERFEAAEEAFRRALAQNPKDDSARIHLARTLISLHRVPEALAEIERTLAGQRDPDIQFQAGRILRALAESRFAALKRAGPNSAALHEIAGRQLELKGDLAGALNEYRSAAALEPRRPGVHYLIGNVLWRMRELDRGAAALESELSLNPHHAMANLRLGQILVARNDDGAALRLLERAVSAMPESTDGRRELGKAYRKLGRLAEARREWEMVANARPEDDQVHYLLGNLYREEGDDARAQEELAKHRKILERRRTIAEKQ